MSVPYERIFKEADKDGSGFLTLGEVTSMLRKNGYGESDDKIKAMFGSIDMSGDQKISMEEFLTAMGAIPPQNHKEASMRRCFRGFDKDGSGSIDRTELKDAMRAVRSDMSDEEIDRLLKIVDKDGSGSINYEEFIAQVFGK